MTTAIGNNTIPPIQTNQIRPTNQGRFSTLQGLRDNCAIKAICEGVKEVFSALSSVSSEIFYIVSRSFYFGIGLAMGIITGVGWYLMLGELVMKIIG